MCSLGKTQYAKESYGENLTFLLHHQSYLCRWGLIMEEREQPPAYTCQQDLGFLGGTRRLTWVTQPQVKLELATGEAAGHFP